jgi:N-acylglucosamine-6-phosphate 2-epimerase
MENYNKIFDLLKNGLIVSCQARGNSPFNSPEGVTILAQAAKLGGAVAIRSEGVKKTEKIIKEVQLPVVGLVKSDFPDGTVRITGSFQDVEDLLAIGTHIVAIDGTFRKREGLTGPEFIHQVKEKYHCIVLADIAEYSEGLGCIEAGADALSTTLSGYTPNTGMLKDFGPDYNLLKNLATLDKIPVFAEGRVNTPDQAAHMIALGAWGVIAGTAITSPNMVTEWYIAAMNKMIDKKNAAKDSI